MAKVRIARQDSEVILPKYQTAGAAGADIHAHIAEPIKLGSLERAMIPTGIKVEVPEGYELQIRARSGLSIKHGIALINGIGTIDSDYRGDLGVLLVNLSKEPFVIEPGMRIAQMVLVKYEPIKWLEVDELNQTGRGDGGYGSTGFAV